MQKGDWIFYEKPEWEFFVLQKLVSNELNNNSSSTELSLSLMNWSTILSLQVIYWLENQKNL